MNDVENELGISESLNYQPEGGLYRGGGVYPRGRVSEGGLYRGGVYPRRTYIREGL